MALRLAGEDKSEARRLQRLATAGKLRRIYPGVYTDELIQPLDSIVRRELFALCSLVAPGAIISHRSALAGGRPTPGGSLFLTGANRRDFDLPGVKLRLAQGAGPLDTDIRIPTFAGDAFISSQARALLENLISSRGDAAERRSLGAEGVEAWLDRFISRDISDAINKIRDTAGDIAGPLGLEPEFKQLDKIIGTLLGTQRTYLTAPAAIARAAGKPYDAARVTLFQTLATELQENPLQVPTTDVTTHSDDLQAFIETYFSNYIEGTEFKIEEAHDIVVQGRPLIYREDDSHDILGTYRAILESKASPTIPQRFEDFAKQLQRWNREVIESRQSKRPGEFKTESNRAGNTVFVAPDLVVGTLERGYESIMSAATPANRAALAMCSRRSSPVYRRQWPHCANCDEPVSDRGSPHPSHHSYCLSRRLHFRTESDVDKFSSNAAGPDACQSRTFQSLGRYDLKGNRFRRFETVECAGPSGDGQTCV